MLQRLDELGEVEAAGATSELPLDGSSYDLGPYAYDTPEGVVEWESVAANYRVVTPGFLQAMRARLVEGRLLEWTDDLDHPTVVVIDDKLARTVFKDRSPIGERLRVAVFIESTRPVWAEIVGVVEHMRHHPREDGIGQIYLPHQQSPQRTMALAIRSPMGEAALLDVVRREVAALNPAQPVQGVRAMNAYLAEAMAPTRFALTLLGIFAVMAVIVAGIGLYGVISYSVGQRVQEFGVRLALGATPWNVRWTILLEGALLTAFGLVLGLVVGVALSGLLQNQLYEISARDPLTFASIALLLSVISLAAVYVPAHRASRLSPTVALRGE